MSTHKVVQLPFIFCNLGGRDREFNSGRFGSGGEFQSGPTPSCHTACLPTVPRPTIRYLVHLLTQSCTPLGLSHSYSYSPAAARRHTRGHLGTRSVDLPGFLEYTPSDLTKVCLVGELHVLTNIWSPTTTRPPSLTSVWRCSRTHYHKAEWVAEAAAAKQALRSIDNLVAAELNVTNNVNGSINAGTHIEGAGGGGFGSASGGGERTPGAPSENEGKCEGKVSPETVRRLAGLKKKMKQRIGDFGGAGGAAGGEDGGIGGSDVRVALGRRTSPGRGRGGRGETELYMSMESTVSLSDAEDDDGESHTFMFQFCVQQ